MSLKCEVIIDPGLRFDHPERLADLIAYAADSEPAFAPADWLMTLRLCDNATIADLHQTFFNDPTPTDVITFPVDEPDNGDGYLGDVVVSIETAAAQAVEGDHSTQREVAFLALHGLLHLCGYDDATDLDRAAMHERQYAHLAAWERERGGSW